MNHKENKASKNEQENEDCFRTLTCHQQEQNQVLSSSQVRMVPELLQEDCPAVHLVVHHSYHLLGKHKTSPTPYITILCPANTLQVNNFIFDS